MTPATVPPKAIGDYRVLDELGRGGQGVVYRCRHEPSGRTAAVKTVSVGHPALFEGIRREILVLRRLRHPGIVRILDDGVARDAPWYAMELVEGEDIAAHARRAWDPRSPGPRDLAATLTPLRRLCATLAYLHGEGIVHRDLKPRNVIVTESGHPVVVDFGLTTRHADLGGRERLEIAGGGGTAAFMAPEQVRGEPVDARADLYAIGCLVYVILTGALPFGTLAEVLDPARSHRPATATGLSLPPEIDELLSRLLAKEPSSRAGYASDVAGDLERLGARNGFPAAAPAPRPYLYRPRLAGREGLARELARHAGERLAGGTGDAIVVRGESGIGKTRLVAEVARRLASRGFQVIAGECSPADPGGTRGAGVALQPFAGVFAAAADLCRAGGAEATRALLGEEGRALTVLPALAALPGGADLAEIPPLPAAAARGRLLRAAAALVSALARPGGLVVAIDDLQWADELSAELFAILAAATGPDRAPLVLLATCRTEETPPGIDALHRAANVVDLEPLDADAVSDMVAGMLALTRPPADLVAHLALRTDGVPFFVAEYVRAAVALGYFERAQGRWRATAGQRWDTLPLPATVGELVACRLGRLEPGARRLASLASVLGREFEGALLEGLASDEGDLRGETAELLARSFLDEPTPGKFRFVHDRVRAVAYGELPVETRSDLHRRTARLLEEREDAWRAENGAELGMHWERAGHPDRARVHYLRAARRLEERFAHAESERLFRAYLALVSAPTSESIAARNELAGLLSHTGRFPEAGTEYEQVRSEAVSIGDAYNEANGLRGMALMRRLAGKLEEAGAIYAEALAIGERAGDVLSHAATLGAYGNLLYHLGRGLEAREAYRKVLAAAEGELPRAGGDRYRLRDVKNLREAAMMNIAVVSMDVGDYEAAESGYRATLAERQARNDTRSAAIVMGDLANLYHATGRTAEALHWAEEALRHHRNTGDRRSEAIVLTNLANVQVTVGRRDLARANYEQALVLAHEIGDVREEAATLRHVAELHEEEGALDEALAAAESSLARFTKLGDRRYIAELQGVVASILVGKGDLSRARGLLDDAIEGSRAAHDRRAEAYHRTTIAGLERRRGDLVAARAALDAAEPTFRELHDLYGIAVVLVERARLRGGGDGDAAALLSQAEEAADALGVGPAGALRSLFTAARRDLGLTGTSV